MQVFCKTHAPHLFYILISTIEGADGHATSERHSHLQQQRIVALLHMLLSLAFTSNYKVPAQSFAIQRIKNYYILYNLQNFQVSFILTVSAVTGNKQPLFLSVITGIICNFP